MIRRFRAGTRSLRTLPQPDARVVGVALGELLDQAPAGLVDDLGHDDLEDGEQVASGLGPRSRDSLPLEPELQSAGAARGDGQRLQAVEGGDVDLGPQDGLRYA